MFRDLPGNLVCAYRVIIWLLAEAEVVAQVDKGQGDPEPHTQQSHHGGKWYLWTQWCEAPIGRETYNRSHASGGGGYGKLWAPGKEKPHAQQGYCGGKVQQTSLPQGSWPESLEAKNFLWGEQSVDGGP